MTTFSAHGVSRAIEVYARLAHGMGINGAKSNKPISEDLVWKHVQRLEKHQRECTQGRCPYNIAALTTLRREDAERRAVLVEIGNIARDSGFGEGHIVDCIRRMAAAAKGGVP